MAAWHEATCITFRLDKNINKDCFVVAQMFLGSQIILCILLIILLPLFLFSTLNPIAESNKILHTALSIKIEINNRAYKIYSTLAAEEIRDIGKE